MSTQQIPTFAQLSAARKTLWHQAVSPVIEATSPVIEATSPAKNADAGEEGAVARSEREADPVAEEGELVAFAAPDDEAAGEMDEVAEALHSGVDEGEPEGADDLVEAGDALAGDAFAGGERDEAEGIEGAGEDEAKPASAAVRTIEGARALIERAGMMPFVPHAALSAAPSPSFVEATLGEPSAAPTLAESATARSLLARLIAEGSAVPLNLLGAPGTTGEAPDFVVSTSAFSYIFTLRGDKGWKQLPATSGASKVSPLAVNTYALLVEGGPRSAYALTGELGKGLTEAAVLRALSELWQQLRVIPVPQMNGQPTLWEPITSRLLRQIKAGANAGQPTALSALISLYLGQVLLATEDEIEVFLSTVAPRSRVRDVVHALMAAQQLETMVLAGKQNVYVAGELPDFASTEERRPRGAAVDGPVLAEDGTRIRRMVKSSRPDGERAAPFRAARAPRAGGFGDRGGGAKMGGARGARPGASAGGFRDRGERPARPSFARGSGADRPARATPRFDRPWEENRPSRPDGGAAGGPGAGISGEGPTVGGRGGSDFAGRGERPRRVGGDRPAFARGQEGRASFGGARSGRPMREGSGERAGERFGPRSGSRPPFERGGAPGERSRSGPSRPGGFGGRESAGPRGSEGVAGPRGDRDGGFGGGAGRERRGFEGGSGGDRRGGGGDRPRTGFGGARPGNDRPSGGRFGGPRQDREGGARPSFGGDRGARPSGPRPVGFRPGASSAAGESGRDGRPPFRRFDAPREGARPFRPSRREDDAAGHARGSGAGDRGSRPGGGPAGDGGSASRAGAGFRADGGRPFRPAGGSRFAAGAAGDSRGPKRPFVKREGSGAPRTTAGRGGDAPGAGPFDKFRDGNKPWGKRPPKRKIKPQAEEG